MCSAFHKNLFHRTCGRGEWLECWLDVTRRYCVESDRDIIKLFLGLVALWFSITALLLRNSNGKGSLSSDGLFRSEKRSGSAVAYAGFHFARGWSIWRER